MTMSSSFTLIGQLELRYRILTPAAVATIYVLSSVPAVDEWHQSFVPGRHASLVDFLLDIVGIGGMLLMVRLSASAAREVGTMSQPVTRP
jgi:VanZ family protein